MTETPLSPEKPQRLSHISSRDTPRKVSKTYSTFIRRVQIVLPIIALVLLGVVFGWNSFQGAPVELTEAPQGGGGVGGATIGKNELLNPQFESLDDKGQPYSVTALRAVQGDEDGADGEVGPMLLEKPKGELALNDGHKARMESDTGVYQQDARRLFLEGNVVLSHDLGYAMQMEQLDVDMEAGSAVTQTAVTGQGPEGTIAASGMQAFSADEVLIFTGPATLVLNLGDEKPLDFGGLAP